MRRLLGLAFLLAASACETQPILGRCESNFDCDPARTPGATLNAFCASLANPANQCPGGANVDCICCPRDPAAAMMIMQCRPGAITNPTDVVVPEAATPDVQDVQDVQDARDATPDTSLCSAACQRGFFCDPVPNQRPADADPAADTGLTGVCAPRRPSGAACSDEGQCATGHCVSGVCCNSACTGAGYSCNAEPNLAGVCTRVGSSGGDAGGLDATAADAAAD